MKFIKKIMMVLGIWIISGILDFQYVRAISCETVERLKEGDLDVNDIVI
ncbi:MAG: hypothetical protein LBB21_02325 [Holosporaceae bacterium]|jgi:hypothetical protein|nr:hypothetical protein [Holosporaceae bacterium]